MDITKWVSNPWITETSTEIAKWLSNPWITATSTVCAIYIIPKLGFVGGMFTYLFRTYVFKDKEVVADYKKDVVYVFMFPRKITKQLLNLSPYSIKLESWLRLKSIQYEVVETLKFSKSTRQIPYIKLNGEEVADTDFIIPYLSKAYNLDDTEGLETSQLGIRRAFVGLVDYRLSWSFFIFRYYYWSEEFLNYFRMRNSKFYTKQLLKILGNGVKYTTSLGRQTEENVGIMGQNDVRAISQYLGDKEFFFGSEPTLADCAFFGHLSHCLLMDINFPHKEVLQNDCKNLVGYMDRFKARIWPDWDEIVDTKCFA